MNSLHLIRRLSIQSIIRPISQPINQSVVRSFHSSRQSSGINEFFYGALAIKTGREWSCADLRLKSFDDLHKLWFVLLKERNMLLSAQQYARSSLSVMVHAERFHKVKKSMAHIKRVLHERHLAVKEATEPANSTWRLAREKRLAAKHKLTEVKLQRLKQPKQLHRQKEGHSLAKKHALSKYQPIQPQSNSQKNFPERIIKALRTKRLQSAVARKQAREAQKESNEQTNQSATQ